MPPGVAARYLPIAETQVFAEPTFSAACRVSACGLTSDGGVVCRFAHRVPVWNGRVRLQAWDAVESNVLFRVVELAGEQNLVKWWDAFWACTK